MQQDKAQAQTLMIWAVYLEVREEKTDENCN